METAGSAYWVGHRAERQILSEWPLSSYPDLIARSERFFERHGTAAVFFARFIPPVRAFVPITAGALDMPPRRFFPVNIAAIALWAPLHVAPGVLAVMALQRWKLTAEHHLVAFAVIAAACGITPAEIKTSRRLLVPPI